MLPDTAIDRIDDPRKHQVASQLGKLFAYPKEWYTVPVLVTRRMNAIMKAEKSLAAYGTCRRMYLSVVIS